MALCHCSPAQALPPLPPSLSRGRFSRLSTNNSTISPGQLVFRSPRRLYVKCSILNDNSVVPEDRSADLEEDALAVNLKRQGNQWAMTVSYDGTRYSGWQIQPKAPTVQGTILETLSQITSCNQDELSLTAAGRTDAGVHAWGQVASFTTPFVFDNLETLHRSLNSMLPSDVRIREITAAQPDFHVRYHPINKTYQYKAYVAPVMDPCKQSYAFHVPYVMNVDAMQEAASFFVGIHNFTAFANASPKAVLSPVREIYKFTVLSSGPDLLFEVQGKSFLYKQVRNMVGLLLKIGKGNLPSSAVCDALASQSRLAATAPAPAHGLYLMSVNYDKAHFLDEPKPSYGRLSHANNRKGLAYQQTKRYIMILS
ncbi:unnamed protein product [Calypogeia fissa]